MRILFLVAFCALLATVYASCGYQTALGGTVTLPVYYDTTIANADSYGIYPGAPNRNYGGSPYIRVRNGTSSYLYGENRALIGIDNCPAQYSWDRSRITSVVLHLRVADWLGFSNEMGVMINEVTDSTWIYYSGYYDWMGSSVESENSYGVYSYGSYAVTWNCMYKYFSGPYDENTYCSTYSYYRWNGAGYYPYTGYNREGSNVANFTVPQTYNSWIAIDLTQSYINHPAYYDSYVTWKLSMPAPSYSTGVGAMFHSAESTNQNSRPYFTITYSALGCDQAGTDGASCTSNNPCAATATCQSGQCVPTSFNTGASCDDGNECTSSDQCSDTGVCMGGDPAYSEGNTCTLSNNACMLSGKCRAGSCVGDTPRNCSAYADSCHDAFCDPEQGCVSIPKANGVSCGPTGSRCSATCRDGYCDSFTPQNCSSRAVDQCNTYGVCNDNTGLCGVVPKTAGTSCNDGNLCTTGDVCSSGICSGTPTTCTVTDSECQETAYCDGSTGSCVVVPKADGTPCGQDKCASTCRKGVCSPSAPVVCPRAPNDGCHISSCDSATGQCLGIKPLDDGTVCNDGKKCTDNDKCTTGVCMGTPKTCGAPSQCHSSGKCDEESGQCVDVMAPFGTACDDGDDDTTNDICIIGQCKGKASDATGIVPQIVAIVLVAVVGVMLF